MFLILVLCPLGCPVTVLNVSLFSKLKLPLKQKFNSCYMNLRELAWPERPIHIVSKVKWVQNLFHSDQFTTKSVLLDQS